MTINAKRKEKTILHKASIVCNRKDRKTSRKGIFAANNIRSKVINGKNKPTGRLKWQNIAEFVEKN